MSEVLLEHVGAQHKQVWHVFTNALNGVDKSLTDLNGHVDLEGVHDGESRRLFPQRRPGLF